MRRYKDELDVANGYKVSSTRTEWVTYANIDKMYQVVYTQMVRILFGDKVGTDISQKDDGNVGGQKIVSKKGSRANIKLSHKDERFTLIELTTATGDPVMCIIIFSAEELTFEQRTDSDIRVPFDDAKTIKENSGGIGKRFPGGPSCMFRGVLVPALVTCTSKGSITSDILTAAFKRLDALGVYQRTSNLAICFV